MVDIQSIFCLGVGFGSGVTVILELAAGCRAAELFQAWFEHLIGISTSISVSFTLAGAKPAVKGLPLRLAVAPVTPMTPSPRSTIPGATSWASSSKP